jgi:hypothetical protein
MLFVMILKLAGSSLRLSAHIDTYIRIFAGEDILWSLIAMRRI